MLRALRLLRFELLVVSSRSASAHAITHLCGLALGLH